MTSLECERALEEVRRERWRLFNAHIASVARWTGRAIDADTLPPIKPSKPPPVGVRD